MGKHNRKRSNRGNPGPGRKVGPQPAMASAPITAPGPAVETIEPEPRVATAAPVTPVIRPPSPARLRKAAWLRPHVIRAIFARNFGAYFGNPAGYVFITLFVLIS